MKKIIMIFICLCFTTLAQAEHGQDSPASKLQVKLFSYQLLLSIYDFDYQQFIQQQKTAAKLFTPQGWMVFQKALLKSKLIEVIQKNRYTVTAVPLFPPKIGQQGMKNGSYQWQVEMPAMVVYKNDSYQQVQYLDIKMNLVYQNKLLAQSFIASPGKPITCQQTTKDLKVTPPTPDKLSAKSSANKK